MSGFATIGYSSPAASIARSHPSALSGSSRTYAATASRAGPCTWSRMPPFDSPHSPPTSMFGLAPVGRLKFP